MIHFHSFVFTFVQDDLADEDVMLLDTGTEVGRSLENLFTASIEMLFDSVKFSCCLVSKIKIVVMSLYFRNFGYFLLYFS